MEKKEYIIVGVFVTIIILAVIFKDAITEMVTGKAPATIDPDKPCKKSRVAFNFSDYPYEIPVIPAYQNFSTNALSSIIGYEAVLKYFQALEKVNIPNTLDPMPIGGPRKETFSFTVENQYLEELDRQNKFRQTPLKYTVNCAD